MRTTMKSLLATVLTFALLIAMIAVPVAAEDTIPTMAFDEFWAAVEAAAEGDTVTLTGNVETDEVIQLEKAITIDGNNKYCVVSSAKKTFEVYADVTFQNISIFNTYHQTSSTDSAGRCVNTRVGGISLTLENAYLEANGTGNVMTVLIGGDTTGTDGVTVTIDASTIKATSSGYAFITYNPVDLSITKQSELSGFCALYFKGKDGSAGSAGSKVQVSESILSSTNVHNGATNDFGTIIFEDNGISIDISDNSEISADAQGDQPQYVLGFMDLDSDEDTVLTATGIEFTADDTCTLRGTLLGGFNPAGTGNKIKLPANNTNLIYGAGYTASSVDADGNITVNGILPEDAVVNVINQYAGTYYTNLSSAVNEASEGDALVILAETLETFDSIKIEKPLAIYGGSDSCTFISHATKSFEVFADLSISDLTVMNTVRNGRCIDTRVGGITLKLNHVYLETYGAGTPQILTIGGDATDTGAVTVDMCGGALSNYGMNSGCYGIIAFNPVNLFMDSCDIYNPYAALYFKGANNSAGSAGSTVQITNSVITSMNPFSGPTNNFGTVVFEDDDINVSFLEDCTLAASGEKDTDTVDYADQYLFMMKNHTGITITADDSAFIDLDNASLIHSFPEVVTDTSVILPTEMKDLLDRDGFTFETVSNGIHILYGANHKHQPQKHEGTDPTCTEPGTITYYTCTLCNAAFTDEACTIPADSLAVPALGHAMSHFSASGPTCTGDGNVEYFYCWACNTNFADEDGNTALPTVIDPATGHSLGTVEGKAPTCTEDGVIAHYHCVTCGQNFSDEACTVGLATVIDPATGHSTEKMEAKAPTYTETGSIEHWFCEACGTAFDAEGNVLSAEAILIPQLIQVEENTADISKDAVDTAIQEAVSAGNETEVVIDLNDVEEGVTSAVIPVESLTTVADLGEDASLTISKADVTVVLDTATLKSVAEQAQGESVVIEVIKVEDTTLNTEQQEAIKDKDVHVTISASILCDDEYIHDFDGGEVTITMPFTPAEGTKGSDYVVLYVADDGSIEEIETDYVDGALVFTLNHFSNYVVINTNTEGTSTPGGPSGGDGNAPATGGSSNQTLLVTLMVLSAACMLVAAVGKKKLTN